MASRYLPSDTSLLVSQRQVGKPAFTDTDRAILASLLDHLPKDRLRQPPAGTPRHDPALAQQPTQTAPCRDLRQGDVNVRVLAEHLDQAGKVCLPVAYLGRPPFVPEGGHPPRHLGFCPSKGTP